MITDVEHLPCTYWTVVYYLWRNVYPSPFSIFILFLTMLVLFLQGFSLVAVSGGYSLVVVQRPLLSFDFLAVDHRLWGTWVLVTASPGLYSAGLNSCGSGA